MGVTFFPTQAKFRKWLEKNHHKEKELIVGFYKVDSGKPSMTWSQSLVHWIMSAKQEKTRLSRLEKTINSSGQQKWML